MKATLKNLTQPWPVESAGSDGYTCSRCGAPITAAEGDDNGGFCMDCAAARCLPARLKDLILGGPPGLNGYTYQADTWCVECGREIIKALVTAGSLMNLAEREIQDTDTIPQPIVFGEAATSQYCANCGTFIGRIPKHEQTSTL